MKKATSGTGSCKDCFFWEDGRGGKRRPLTTTKRKTCFEKGMTTEDSCDLFVPIHMHPLCGTCKWLDTSWHAMTCRERYAASEGTTGNYHCKDKYTLGDDYTQAIQKDTQALLYNQGRPVQVLKIDTTINQDILLKMGDQAILISDGETRTIKLEKGMPVIERQSGAYSFQLGEDNRVESSEDVKSMLDPVEDRPKVEIAHGNVIGEVALPKTNPNITEEVIEKMLLRIAAMERQQIARSRAIARAVKISGRKYGWSSQLRADAEAVLKRRINQ